MNPAPNNSSLTSKTDTPEPVRSEFSGQAPDQPPETTVNTIPSVGSTPNPSTPIPHPPASSVPLMNNSSTQADQQSTINIPFSAPPPPTTVSSPPPPHKKFPFMMVTFLLVVVLAGFAGSFLFFQNSSSLFKIKKPSSPANIVITPPVTVIPATPIVNPFATTSADLANPFASPSAAANPFGTYENPFSSATPSGTQTYQNPFENLK